MLNLFVLHSVRMKYYIRVWKKDQVHVCVWECVITCQTLASPKYQKNQNKQKKNSFLFHCLSLSPFFHLLWLWDNKCLVNAWQRLKSELRWKSFVIKSCLPHQNIKRDISLSCNYHFNFLTFTPPATVDVCHCHVTPAWIPAFGIFPAALPCNQISFFPFLLFVWIHYWIWERLTSNVSRTWREYWDFVNCHTLPVCHVNAKLTDT